MTSGLFQMQGLLLCALIAWFTIRIARRRGFFHLSGNGKPIPEAPSPGFVIAAFCIYFSIVLLFPLLLSRLSFIHTISPISLLSWMNCLISLCIFAGLCLLLSRMNRKTVSEIIGTFRREDLKSAFLSWIVAFPLVLFSGQLLEMILIFLLKISEIPDQRAIAFLKAAFEQPLYFILAAISIVILAPLVEELLFRGFLQKGLRRYFSPALSIFFSSISFSAFHFTTDQGAGNIPILGSLFIFGGFLGFVYERQRSLYAPIALHAIFNAISIINLYFLGT